MFTEVKFGEGLERPSKNFINHPVTQGGERGTAPKQFFSQGSKTKSAYFDYGYCAKVEGGVPQGTPQLEGHQVHTGVRDEGTPRVSRSQRTHLTDVTEVFMDLCSGKAWGEIRPGSLKPPRVAKQPGGCWAVLTSAPTQPHNNLCGSTFGLTMQSGWWIPTSGAFQPLPFISVQALSVYLIIVKPRGG